MHRNDANMRCTYVKMLTSFTCSVLLLFLPGCSILPPPTAPNPSTVGGDWDDCLAAADYAMTAGECAVISTKSQTDRELVLNIRSVADDLGTLSFTRKQASPGDTSKIGEPIVVEAFLGIAGSRDSTRERRLVAAVVRRLRELQGVEWAPTGD